MFYFLWKLEKRSVEIENFIVRFDFDCCLMVDSVGKIGALALLWNKEISLIVKSFSLHYINAEVLHGTLVWQLIGFYGYFNASNRPFKLAFTQNIKSTDSISWLCVGDFNKIFYASEKFGGVERSDG